MAFKAGTTYSAKRERKKVHHVYLNLHFVLTSRVSTLRSAIELKSVFDQIQAAEKNGNLNPEERKKLEEQAAEKGLQALFKVLLLSLPPPYPVVYPNTFTDTQGTKLEIESVLRETCERVLSDPNIPPQKAVLRAVALQVLGEAYMSVKKDIQEDSEYVRVETKNSRERARAQKQGGP